jgi:hypothetical protein
MAALTDTALRALRNEVGVAPSDDVLADLFTELQSIPAVALAVLRPRLADGRAAAAAGGFSLAGVLGTTAPSAESLKQLDAQILRLEGLLAAETGVLDASGIGSSFVLQRHDRVR